MNLLTVMRPGTPENQVLSHSFPAQTWAMYEKFWESHPQLRDAALELIEQARAELGRHRFGEIVGVEIHGVTFTLLMGRGG